MEKKDDELQSRREFFKNAAKRVLPIIGALALSNPIIRAASTESIPTGCYGCSGTCYGSCSGSCTSSCLGSCSSSCMYECYQTCNTTCYQMCTASCRGTCKL